MDDQSSEAHIFLAEPLTQRETEILSLFAADLSNREIADRLTVALSTVKWYARQIYTKLGVNSRRQAVERARNLGLLEYDLPQHGLPTQTVPFFGRERELDIIDRLLTDPECRLLTLTGLGGVGKTSLAIQAVRRLPKERCNIFRDGIYFVSLSPFDDASSIVSTIAEALKFYFYEGDMQAKQQLIDYLRQKRVLLMLDNFEHLVNEDSTCLLVDILSAAPGVKLLVTSRSRLNVLGEQVLQLSGLSVPEVKDDIVGSVDAQRALSYSSIQLFQRTARRVQLDFAVTSHNLNPIIRICRFTEGLPLGIELAASWMAVMEPEEILAEIESSLDFLESEMYDLPERQRSIRAVFDASWRLLSEEEREAVQNLSVFQGGFTHQAAKQVGDVSLKTLLMLHNKSWVQRESSGRFQFHELLRAYANQSLRDDSTEWGCIRESHAAYFCGYVREREVHLCSNLLAQAIGEIEREIDNIIAAWRWAVKESRVDLLELVLYGLCTFFDFNKRLEEGETLCRMATDKLGEQYAGGDRLQGQDVYTWAKITAWGARFTSDYQAAGDLLGQSQAILDRSAREGDDFQAAQALLWGFRGYHYGWEDRQKARDYYQKSLDFYKELGNEWEQSRMISGLGWVAWVTGEFKKAQPLLEGCWQIQKEIGDQLGEAKTLNLLAGLAKHQGRFEEAVLLHRQSLELVENLGARWEVAERFQLLAHALTVIGRFAEALEHAQKSLQIYDDLGYSGAFRAKTLAALAVCKMHLGNYSGARDFAQQGLAIARENFDNQDIGYNLTCLGQLALVGGSYQEARDYLKDGYSVLKNIRQHYYVSPLSLLGHIDISQGETFKDSRRLIRSLEKVEGNHSYLLFLRILPTCAFFFAKQGQASRAIELYALASRYPLIAKSCWYKDTVGDTIADVAASLPQDIVAAYQKQGQSLDIWETAEGLLVELKGLAQSAPK